MDRVFAGLFRQSLTKMKDQTLSPVLWGVGGHCHSVRRCELQRIEAAYVYSPHLSVLGLGVGDLVGWEGLSPM